MELETLDQQSQQKRASEKLVQNLEDLTKLYRQVLDIVRKEKDFLIESNIEALNESNVQKEKLILKMRSLDALRLNYASDLARLVGADESQTRLLDIAKRLQPAEGDRFRNLHATLDVLLKRVSDFNQENATYAEAAINTISGAINNIKDTVTGKKTYGPQGKMRSGNQSSGSFVSKEK